ncbi:hypothetical protein BLAT2472_130034 [Burkholderia latens]
MSGQSCLRDKQAYLVITPFGDVGKQPPVTSSGGCGAARRALCDPFPSSAQPRPMSAT